MNKKKTSSNVLEKFRKQEKFLRIDKISLSKSRIGFPTGFMILNKLTQLNYVEIFYNIEDRKIAFAFSNVNKKSENHKLIKEKGEYYRYRKLSKKVLEELNISESDYGQYSYTKHLEDGKEIYIIQLNTRSK